MMSVALALHLLAAVIWVGGMFFAYILLRPVAAAMFEPPRRLQLWLKLFDRFFRWVWAAVILLPVTGVAMVMRVFGGFGGSPTYIHVMTLLGVVMIAIFCLVFFGHLGKLRDAVVTEQWPVGGARLDRIRKLIGINLILGLLVIAIAGGGRYIA